MVAIQRNEYEARTHKIFSALMWALSYPGRPQSLPTAGLESFRAIGEALIDLETSYYTPHAELNQQLQHTGARGLQPDTAAYQFYPQLHEAELPALEQAPSGSQLYPDTAVTLVLGCGLGSGLRLRLTGPGIKDDVNMQVDALPNAFWSLRERACHYPLGWDVLLVADDQVVGLPRTTVVEVR